MKYLRKVKLKLQNISVSQELYSLASDILESEMFLKMQNFSHHNQLTTMEHSIHVAERSLEYVNKHNIKCNKRALVVGCLLHDFFLYDYHVKGNRFAKWHAFTHPRVALENANKHFELSKLECEIIKKHMLPTTIVPPTKKEVWIIVWEDKVCAVKEMIQRNPTKKVVRI
jgi:uncharacterized protein